MLKVLIAEDDLLMADMLEDALVDNGYEVCGIARTVEKAVELGEKHRPDLAILDLRLEGRGSGTDVADALKRQGRVGVLYATGHITTIGLTSSDGEACIAKPYRIEDIVRGLEIVEQIVLTGESSGPIPKGFTILPGPGEGISPSPEFTGSSIDEFPNFSATEFSVLARRMRLQQTELLSFSDYALSEPDLGKLMSEGTRVCAACLGVSYCTIGRFRAQDNVFVAEAPFGLHASFAGRALPIDHNTPFGRAFSPGKPVVSADLIDDVRFALPSYYAEHGIVSVLAVTIMSEAGKFGVLAVGSTVRRDFDAVDAGFLTGFGNVLGRAVNAAERGDNLKHVTDRLHDMITDRDRYIETHKRILAGKDRLLETRTVLTRELEHRVRNNLQLIYSMLTQQLGSATDEAGVEALGKIASRVMILVGIYDQLLGTDLGRTIDFGEYLATLCSSFSSLHTAGHPKVQLACRTRGIAYDLSPGDLACGVAVGWIPTMGFSAGAVPWKSLLHALRKSLTHARTTCGTICTRC